MDTVLGVKYKGGGVYAEQERIQQTDRERCDDDSADRKIPSCCFDVHDTADMHRVGLCGLVASSFALCWSICCSPCPCNVVFLVFQSFWLLIRSTPDRSS